MRWRVLWILAFTPLSPNHASADSSVLLIGGFSTTTLKANGVTFSPGDGNHFGAGILFGSNSEKASLRLEIGLNYIFHTITQPLPAGGAETLNLRTAEVPIGIAYMMSKNPLVHFLLGGNVAYIVHFAGGGSISPSSELMSNAYAGIRYSFTPQKDSLFWSLRYRHNLVIPGSFAINGFTLDFGIRF